MSDQPSKIDSQSLDIEQADRNKLQSLFPQCFSEGKLDIDKLLNLCGEYIDESHEKYKFEWKGKAESYRHSGKRSNGTLRPAPAESVNFDNTQNLYIEGDNLEVLKLLQKSYYGKVKMIFIDPPYNTGNDFVYNDDFKEPLTYYKQITSQATKSNPESMGRFHTAWLNMMYPRLRLAANLLKDQGMIFIAIDDTEVHNLRKLCDEVFGEENFIADFVWEKRFTRNNDAKLMSSVIDHVLCYRRSDALNALREPRTEKANSIYSNPDSDPRGVWTSVSYVSQRTKEQRPNLSYEMYNPITQKTVIHDVNAWKYSKEQYEMHSKENRLYWGKEGNNTYPRLKRFLSELKDGMVPINLWSYRDVGTLDDGTKTVNSLIGKDIFDYPKPISLIQKMLHLATEFDNGDIVLDFFSGSGTTAHAVMQLNAEDGGNRRFIMVQLPEITDEKSEAYKAGYKNICEIGKERIRRAGSKIISELTEGQTAPDTGFRVLKLDTSNLVAWDGTPIQSTDKELRQAELWDRISARDKTIKPDRSELDVVFEVMLKMGVDLNTAVTEITAGERKCYTVGEVLICLDFGITADDVTAFCELQPKTIVVAEEAFAGSTAMSNAHYILKDRDIEMKLL